MKNFTKRLFTFVVALAVSFGTFSAFSICASAETADLYLTDWLGIDDLLLNDENFESITIDGIKYCYANKYYSTACVFGADKEAISHGVMTIPEKITVNGVEKTVTGFATQPFRSHLDNPKYNNDFIGINRIVLPDTLEYINLQALGTKEYPVTVVLGKNADKIVKERHSHLKKSTQNLFEYITIDASKSDKFTIKDDLLLKGNEIIAFLGGDDSYKIPSWVKKLNGFNLCDRIKSVTIPKTVEEIAERAFADCSNIEKITFRSRDTDILINHSAFYKCNKVKSVTVPGKLHKDSEFAFANMKGLQKVTFAKKFSLKKITGIFYSCSSLKSVKLPKCVKTIGRNTFSCCAFESFTVPEQVQSIEEGAFSDCKKLKKISLPKNLKVLGRDAFSGCKKLKTVTVPKNVTSIGNLAFSGCSSLESVKFIGNKVKQFGNDAFAYCKSLKNFTVQKNVTVLGDYVFNHAENLEKITVCGNVKTIGNRAFSCCFDLKTLNFKGKYLEKIGEEAFDNCKKLEKITISNTKNAPKFDKTAFSNAKKGIKFYVKNKTVAKKLKANLKKVGYNSYKIYVNGQKYS